MNWNYGNFAPAAVIAFKRSNVHLVGYCLTNVIFLAVGLPFEFGAVPEFPFVRMSLAAVAFVALIVLLTWGMVLAGSVAGHFYSALDELRDACGV
ncbi:hypothetical protein GC176_08735 [bacterium]|nr:hypothetical protein [bacterium]